MTSAAKKKWTINPGSGEAVVIEADTLELDDARVRATFKVGDDIVASFVGFSSVYPTPS